MINKYRCSLVDTQVKTLREIDNSEMRLDSDGMDKMLIISSDSPKNAAIHFAEICDSFSILPNPVVIELSELGDSTDPPRMIKLYRTWKTSNNA